MLCCGVELLCLGWSKNAVLCGEVGRCLFIFILVYNRGGGAHVSGGCILIFIIFCCIWKLSVWRMRVGCMLVKVRWSSLLFFILVYNRAEGAEMSGGCIRIFYNFLLYLKVECKCCAWVVSVSCGVKWGVGICCFLLQYTIGRWECKWVVGVLMSYNYFMKVECTSERWVYNGL